MAIWNGKYETMPRDELEQLQLERLQVTVNRAYRNVSFYRKLLNDAKISPEDITSLSDLSKIPFTTKEMLRENQPYGMFALPLREVIRLQTTSGTTGEPIVAGYTQRDIEYWTELIARVLIMSGVTKDDVVQISFDYGLFAGALGFHYGAEKIGATVIPCSRVSLEKQIAIMCNYRTTVLICTPTFAFQIAEFVMQKGVNLAELSLRVGLFGAEPWSEEMRRKIEDTLHITAMDNYGLSEIIGPGVAGECEQKNGLHIFEEHFIPEIINPKTGEVLSNGEKGELVLTTITKEAFPMIRYRTGDISSLERSTCDCGRTLARMSRVVTRTDDMIVIQGVNIFPSAVGKILAEIEGAEPHFRLIVDRNQMPEELEVWVEVSEDIFSDEMKGLVALKQRIQGSISESLGLSARVKLVEPKSIRESS